MQYYNVNYGYGVCQMRYGHTFSSQDIVSCALEFVPIVDGAI